MNSFCGQVLKLNSLSQIQQPKAKKGDVAATHKAVSEYIGKVIARTDSFVQGLKGLPSAPAPEGDKAVQDLIGIFTPAKNNLVSVKNKLDASAPTDKQAVSNAAKGMKSFSGALRKVANPMKTLKGSGLASAAKQAGSCKKLGA